MLLQIRPRSRIMLDLSLFRFSRWMVWMSTSRVALTIWSSRLALSVLMASRDWVRFDKSNSFSSGAAMMKRSKDSRFKNESPTSFSCQTKTKTKQDRVSLFTFFSISFLFFTTITVTNQFLDRDPASKNPENKTNERKKSKVN